MLTPTISTSPFIEVTIYNFWKWFQEATKSSFIYTISFTAVFIWLCKKLTSFFYLGAHIDPFLAIMTTIYDFSFWFYFTDGTLWTGRKRAAYARVNVWVGAKGKEEEGDSHPKCIMQEEAIILLLQYKNISTTKEGWRWHFLSVQQPTTSNSITRLTIKQKIA